MANSHKYVFTILTISVVGLCYFCSGLLDWSTIGDLYRTSLDLTGASNRNASIDNQTTNIHNRKTKSSSKNIRKMHGVSPSRRFGIKTNESKLLLTIYRQGRLGNEMWQFSAMFGLALLTNRTPVLPPTFRDLENTFELSVAIETNVTLLKAMKTYEEEAVYNVARTQRDITNMSSNVMIVGYLQSFKFFQHISQDIRSEFTFQRTIQEKVAAYFEQANVASDDIIKVGIHLRRKQLNTKGWIQRGFGPPPMSYYYNAMKYFKEKYKNVYFIVCSDNIGWAMKNVVGDNIIFVPSHAAAIDMAILASCDHVIIGNGTYSWWAGWLCKGITARYKGMPKNNTQLHTMVSGDMWPPEDDYNHYVAIDS